jgi:hypothetical protein
MDISADNFRDHLQLMIESVKSCDFIALDTEFSGLSVGQKDIKNSFDEPEGCY